MMERANYLSATRHPWPCLLFLLPLLIAYEIGVFCLGGTQPEMLRNGADSWMRWGIASFGLNPLYWSPALVLTVFVIGTLTCPLPKPEDPVGIWVGMALESGAYALGLWGLSRAMGPFLDHLGVELVCSTHMEAARQVITYVGAGIYEEVLFRLLLFSGMVWLLKMIGLPSLLAILAGAVGSAVVFSAAHHMGPFGEPFDGFAFLFRSIAGVYFALLFQFRGFGIVVGAHSFYDVLVGVLVR